MLCAYCPIVTLYYQRRINNVTTMMAIPPSQSSHFGYLIVLSPCQIRRASGEKFWGHRLRQPRLVLLCGGFSRDKTLSHQNKNQLDRRNNPLVLCQSRGHLPMCWVLVSCCCLLPCGQVFLSCLVIRCFVGVIVMRFLQIKCLKLFASVGVVHIC